LGRGGQGRACPPTPPRTPGGARGGTGRGALAVRPDVVAAALRANRRYGSACGPDRLTYLQRPEPGRALDAPTRAPPVGEWDVVFVAADGLSSRAVHEHGAAMVERRGAAPTACRWPRCSWRNSAGGPRDDVAIAMGATMSWSWSATAGDVGGDSLGAYLTYRRAGGDDGRGPNASATSGRRWGLSYEVAGGELRVDGRQGKLEITGVGLKDESITWTSGRLL